MFEKLFGKVSDVVYPHDRAVRGRAATVPGALSRAGLCEDVPEAGGGDSLDRCHRPASPRGAGLWLLRQLWAHFESSQSLAIESSALRNAARALQECDRFVSVWRRGG